MRLYHMLQKINQSLQKKGMGGDNAAQRIVMVALQWSSLEFLRKLDGSLSKEEQGRVEVVLQRCLQKEPLSRILGRRGFWRDEFLLSPLTLDPRPETEGIIEHALSFFQKSPPPENILDLGTGTGCLLLSLLREFPQALGLGIDCQWGAIRTAQQNARLLNLTDRALFITGSWMEMLKDGVRFDLIVANPPYIPSGEIPFLDVEVKDYDPQLALDGGEDGLSCYRQLIPDASSHLSSRGCFLLEIGSSQGTSVSQLLREFFKGITVFPDLAKKERYVICSL